MARFVGVVGDTGSGKSRAILNLDPKTTVIINVLGKDLPFKGASKIYNAENKNMFRIDSYPKLIEILLHINKNEYIKTVVIDDMRFLMTKEFFQKALETGYGKFTVCAKNFQSILELVQQCRTDLTVFGCLHDEDVFNDKILTSKKLKLIGKLVEDQYNPIEVMGICLWCKPEITKDGTIYQFITNRCLVNGIEIPAKSPEGMFESLTIPNDLSIVVQAINDYY
jgi:hypothetical protein